MPRESISQRKTKRARSGGHFRVECEQRRGAPLRNNEVDASGFLWEPADLSRLASRLAQ
jgi:hypothetical protein